MSINFLDPIYYDVNDITDDMPDKELLKSLFKRMNEQNERLWMFFTEMCEDPKHKRMTPNMIKPRTLRARKWNNTMRHKTVKCDPDKPRAIDDVDSDEFMEGYKAFMKEEFGDS